MNIQFTNFKYTNPLIPLNLNKVLFIMVHHIDAEHATPQDIHQWHLANGWAGFGYNEFIAKDGTVYIGRGDYIGAQCANMNSKSYGIAVEGDYDKETQMPPDQFNSLVARIKYNQKRFPNFIRAAQHKEFVDTSCPGKFFPWQMLQVHLNSDVFPRLRVNGNFVNAELRILDNRMYAPVRVLGEALGKTVSWDDISKIADVK